MQTYKWTDRHIGLFLKTPEFMFAGEKLDGAFESDFS